MTARRRHARIDTCRNCRRTRRIRAHNLCSACAERWDRAGRPATVPPPMPYAERVARRGGRQSSTSPASRTARIEDYRWLLEQGSSRDAAAEQLGVSVRTCKRYDLYLKQAAGGTAVTAWSTAA